MLLLKGIVYNVFTGKNKLNKVLIYWIVLLFSVLDKEKSCKMSVTLPHTYTHSLWWPAVGMLMHYLLRVRSEQAFLTPFELPFVCSPSHRGSQTLNRKSYLDGCPVSKGSLDLSVFPPTEENHVDIHTVHSFGIHEKDIRPTFSFRQNKDMRTVFIWDF